MDKDAAKYLKALDAKRKRDAARSGSTVSNAEAERQQKAYSKSRGVGGDDARKRARKAELAAQAKRANKARATASLRSRKPESR